MLKCSLAHAYKSTIFLKFHLFSNHSYMSVNCKCYQLVLFFYILDGNYIILYEAWDE